MMRYSMCTMKCKSMSRKKHDTKYFVYIERHRSVVYRISDDQARAERTNKPPLQDMVPA
jgi:hypothetical protein